MTAWKLVPVGAGPHLFVRAYAGVDANHLVNVGTLELRREDYADLAARLGARQAFTPASSRPLAVNSWMTGAELLAAIQAVSDFAERLADGEWETLTGPVTGAQLGELLTALEKVGERLVTCWCWSSPVSSPSRRRSARFRCNTPRGWWGEKSMPGKAHSCRCGSITPA